MRHIFMIIVKDLNKMRKIRKTIVEPNVSQNDNKNLDQKVVLYSLISLYKQLYDLSN